MAILPYKDSDLSKKKQVEDMFDRISHRYDLLNHLLSANIDKLWRRNAIRMLRPHKPRTILDIATGTADFAVAAAQLKPEKITGIDLSEGMLRVGRKKIEKNGMGNFIELLKADSEALPFENDSYDAAIVAFGVRNFENLQKGLREIFRVLKPGGVFIVLEFSMPHNLLFRRFYFFYFSQILPLMGRVISRNNRAYSYLPESVREFPDGKNFTAVLETTGFQNCMIRPLTMGIASIYKAQKPDN
jgi:demethylmenaquinone methyltransferase / 2-methoxy-6-polyprenyl-1,4-benzoquinol methylase